MDPEDRSKEMSSSQTGYEHWEDLTKEQREALVRQANSVIFWQNLWSRLAWMKSAATVLITILAAFTLLRDGLADTLRQWLGK